MTANSYKGYINLILNDEEMAKFYEGNFTNFNILENEYILLSPANNPTDIVDKFIYRDNKFKKVNYQIIDGNYSGRIKPRNDQQEIAINMLHDDATTIKLITGHWGTGKTMLLAAAALEAIQKNKFEKIVWIRNNVQVKDTDQMGALPGDEFEKLLPYVMPLADHCGGVDGIKYLMDNQQLEIIPLAFLRGRSIRNSIIISSEAENLTKQHIQLLIGRVDEGSNLWLDADCRQRDRSVFEKSAGVETLIDRLKGEKLFGYVHLEKVERSETARLADKLD